MGVYALGIMSVGTECLGDLAILFRVTVTELQLVWWHLVRLMYEVPVS